MGMVAEGSGWLFHVVLFGGSVFWGDRVGAFGSEGPKVSP